ncbi:hypothetical protein [Ralstonia pickettii]|uniref:hypothetical protein n=1 Tax=Ralstonia pickettii TaxID=329 RepID=UPI0009B8856F|nr:hypothetical protein [Ralstonia pickettii]
MDEQAVSLWANYSKARNEMLQRTGEVVPWSVVRADDKRVARLNVIKDMLHRLHYSGKNNGLVRPQAEVVFPYDEKHLKTGAIAK